MIKITPILLVWLFYNSFSYSQNSSNDLSVKLHSKLLKTKLDKDKVPLLLQLEDYHLDLSNKINNEKAIDSALLYAKKALAMSENIGYKKGVANS